MSGIAVVHPISIALMELPIAISALGHLGYELIRGVTEFRCGKNVLDADYVFRSKSGLKIALRKDKHGKLELLVDKEELRKKEGIEVKELERQIQRRYAYVNLMEKLKAEGYTVVEEEHREDETIRLVVRRWR